MASEIAAYFRERYLSVSWSVTPEYWPEFQSREEVDNWIASMSALLSSERG